MTTNEKAVAFGSEQEPVQEPVQEVKRGWTLPCPCCGESQASITLDLSDLAGLHCQDCDTDFTADDVRAFIRRWGPVLRWLDNAPAAVE